MSSWKLGAMFFLLLAVIVPALDEADAIVPETAEAAVTASQQKNEKAWAKTVAKESAVKAKARKEAWKAVKSSLSTSELADKQKAQAKQQQQQAAWKTAVKEQQQKQDVADARAAAQHQKWAAHRAKMQKIQHHYQVAAERSWDEDKSKMEAKQQTQKLHKIATAQKRSKRFIKMVEAHQKEVIQKSTQAAKLKDVREVDDANWNEMMEKTHAANKRLKEQAEGKEIGAQGSALGLPTED